MVGIVSVPAEDTTDGGEAIMGMVMPSLPVRKPGMSDDEWRRFLERYRKEVLDPMARHIEQQARLGSIGLVVVLLVMIAIAVIIYFR